MESEALFRQILVDDTEINQLRHKMLAKYEQCKLEKCYQTSENETSNFDTLSECLSDCNRPL